MRKSVALALFALAGCSKDSPPPAETETPSVAPPHAEAAPPAAPSASASGDSAAPSPPASASAASTTSSSPTSTPPSTVRLLDPGRAPRRALRYAWRPEQKEQMAIVLSTIVSADSPNGHQDVRLPPLHVAIAIDPQGTSPEGDLAYGWRVTSAGADDDAGAPADVAQGWRAQIVPLEHLSGRGVVSSRGLTRGVTLDQVAGDAGAGGEMVVQVLQMLRDAAAPLPEEPVGKGARWQKMSSIDAKNSHASETDTFTLTDLQGDKGSLDDMVAQTTSSQALPTLVGVDASQSPPARMDSLLMSGSSKTRFDLTRLIPQTSLDATTSMALSASTNRVNMVMRINIAIQGSTR